MQQMSEGKKARVMVQFSEHLRAFWSTEQNTEGHRVDLVSGNGAQGKPTHLMLAIRVIFQ